MQSIITSTITLILLIAQSSPRGEITGKWQSVEEINGFRSLLEFRQDGSFWSTAGIVFNLSYKIEGNRLIDNSPKSDQSTDLDAVEFRIEGSKLVLKTSEGEIALTRIGEAKPSGPAIVGKWEIKGGFFHGGDDGSWVMEFTDDGQYRGIMQSEPEAGRYKSRGKWLTLRSDGKSRIVKYRFEDGILVLDSYLEKGKEVRYKRIEW